MNIQYFQNNIFKLGNKESSLVLAPKNGEKTAKLKADIFSFTRQTEVSASGSVFTINTPGEYDIKGIFIQGFNFSNKKVSYLINIENITFCYLENLKKDLNDIQIEKLNEIDVLLLDITEINLALRILKQIEPKMVIPMCQKKDKFKKFLSEIRIEPKKIIGKFNLKKTDLSEKKMEIIIFGI